MGRRAAEDTIELRTGLHLYKRSGKNWQVYIKLKKQTPVRKSLWTDDLEEAKELAWQEYSATKERSAKGQTLRKVPFKKLVDDYLLSMGKSSTKPYHEDTIKRHLKPYFSKQLPDFSLLSDSDILDYMQWRRQKAVNEKRGLANKTINRENIVLRGIIKHAVKRGYLLSDSAPIVESLKEQAKRRPHFTREEYNTLYTTANRRIGEVTKSDLKEQRRLLYDFIIFMANSGLRANEVNQLRWRNVDFRDKVIRLEAGVTKTKKARDVVGRDPVMNRMGAVRKRQEDFASKHGFELKGSDYVFSLPKIENGVARLHPVKNFKTSFNNLLKACEFEYDAHREKHTVTSLRHTYATLRLLEGTSIDALARNMGTSVRMIEQHYGHVRTEEQRAELTKMRPRP